MTFVFPSDFTWGVATAAYQVEGAVQEDGRTPSIWDTFCTRKGAILDHSSGEVACDQYHRYVQDIELMKQLGVNAYRLSISWPRIVPDSSGIVNQAGIDHYARLLSALREAGVTPIVTMYHWDLPQYLEDIGGWTNRQTALRFAEYAGVLAAAFGDLVGTWTTLNEPWCSAYLGYGNGVHAPGVKDHAQALQVVHHLNLAHGLAAQSLYAALGDTANVSVTLNPAVNIAATDVALDQAAKRRADLIANEVFLGPMLDGCYDSEIFQMTAAVSDWSFVRDGDMEIIHQPLQSLGINYYSPTRVRHAFTGAPAKDEGMPGREGIESLSPDGELTAMGWEQKPDALTDLLMELSGRYPELPLVITENGSAWDDEITKDSRVPGGVIIHDSCRVAYLDAHIRAVANAIQAGANVTGYFAWSLLDNFEWSFGYTKRFGIIGVDYGTQQRIWKDSALRYAQIIRANAI